MFKRFLCIFYARNREFFRERSSLTYSFVFPFILIFGFAIIFQSNNALLKVGFVGSLDAYTSEPAISSLQNIRFLRYYDYEKSQQLLRHHQIDLLVDLDAARYWVNRQDSKGYLAERLLLADNPEYQAEKISGTLVRYVDWVLPGILCMNIMYSCLFGIGYTIVRYRKNGVLKRFNVTGIHPIEFLLGHLSSRLLIVLFSSAVIYIGAHISLQTLQLGQYWHLALIFILGAICMLSLSLLIAARSRNEELTGGIINILAWPMMGLSGLWFTLEGAPSQLQQVSQWLPLTHMVEAARKVSNEGAGLAQISSHLWVLVLMSAVFLSLAAWLFNWQADGR